jgi:hypothetical protein
LGLDQCLEKVGKTLFPDKHSSTSIGCLHQNVTANIVGNKDAQLESVNLGIEGRYLIHGLTLCPLAPNAAGSAALVGMPVDSKRLRGDLHSI